MKFRLFVWLLLIIAGLPANSDPGLAEPNPVDFVTAQILRHWNVDPALIGGGELQIPIRVVVMPDGTVVKAELKVDRARYESDPHFRSAAAAATRAVLMTSPLSAPPGQPNFFRDHPEFMINVEPIARPH